jgi:hypothetical protein
MALVVRVAFVTMALVVRVAFVTMAFALGAVVAGSHPMPAHAAESPAQQAPEAPVRSCLEDALGRRYCAPEESGTAVRDSLGRILCAAGACVQQEDVWHCAQAPGGSAYLTREGEPECDGGCATPEPTNCEEI